MKKENSQRFILFKMNKLEMKKSLINKIELKLIGHHFSHGQDIITAILNLCNLTSFDSKKIYDLLIDLFKNYKHATFYNYSSITDIIDILNKIENEKLYGFDYKYYVLVAHFGEYATYKKYGSRYWDKLILCDMDKLSKIIECLKNKDDNQFYSILDISKPDLLTKFTKWFTASK